MGPPLQTSDVSTLPGPESHESAIPGSGDPPVDELDAMLQGRMLPGPICNLLGHADWYDGAEFQHGILFADALAELQPQKLPLIHVGIQLLDSVALGEVEESEFPRLLDEEVSPLVLRIELPP